MKNKSILLYHTVFVNMNQFNPFWIQGGKKSVINYNTYAIYIYIYILEILIFLILYIFYSRVHKLKYSRR